MKYILSLAQLHKNLEGLKNPIIKYWKNGGNKNIISTLTFFSLPSQAYGTVEKWLFEFEGGMEGNTKLIKELMKEIYYVQSGTYEFYFFLRNLEIQDRENSIDIFFDAVVDEDGNCDIETVNGTMYTKIKDAVADEDIGWEVEDELKDSIIDFLKKKIGIKYSVHIDTLRVREI